MEITKGKIILIIVIAYFAIMGVKNINKEKSTNSDILKKVTVVSDGKIDPANEGKLVLVCGKISFDGKIAFEELDEPINSFKVSRKVEEFFEYAKDGKKHYEWRERTTADQNASKLLDFLYSTEKTITPNVGEFFLDEQGLDLVKANDRYTKQESIANLKHNGLFYTNPAHDDLDVPGDVRIDYRYYDVDENPYLSVLAEQHGKTFKPFEMGKNNEVYRVFKGQIDNTDKLKEELDKQVKKNKSGRIWFIGFIALVGIGLIISSKKNTEAKQNTKKQKKD